MLNLSETIIGEPHEGSSDTLECKVSKEFYSGIIGELGIFLNKNYREITEDNVGDILDEILDRHKSMDRHSPSPKYLKYFSKESIKDFILKYGTSEFSVNFERQVGVTYSTTYELDELPEDLDINDRSKVYEWVTENSTGFHGDIGSDDQSKSWEWSDEFDEGISSSAYYSHLMFPKSPVQVFPIKSDEEWTKVYKDLGLARFLEDYPKEVA